MGSSCSEIYIRFTNFNFPHSESPEFQTAWLNYSFIGKQISNTPFIALKCPLHEYFFNDDIPQEKRFSPGDTKTLIPSLSMIIDLTFTYKYYDRKAFDNLGIVYKKIPCVGHEIPNFDVLKRFFQFVDEFLQNRDDGKAGLIGVHCTHGVNRTGFFICSYLISKLGYTFENAVKAFNEARGHNIERQNYLNQLQLYEKKPLSFVYDENDIDPNQGFNAYGKTKERIKPRYRHHNRFCNIYTEQKGSSKISYHPRRYNESFYGKYQQNFHPSSYRMPHPNSRQNFKFTSHNPGIRNYYRSDRARFNPSAIPSYQNIFESRKKKF